MEIKRGLKKGIYTSILAGVLYLLPVGDALGQSPRNSLEDKGNQDIENDISKAEGRAIVSPENEFDHKPYAEVRFVNDNLNKDTTFYADHMGIVSYSLPVQEGKDSTRYKVHAFPGDKKESDDFVPYKTSFSVEEGKNDLDALSKKSRKSKLENIAGNEN